MKKNPPLVKYTAESSHVAYISFKEVTVTIFHLQAMF